MTQCIKLTEENARDLTPLKAMAAMESDPAAVRQMLLMMVGQERIDQFLEMAQHSPELAGEGGGLSTAIDEGAIED